MTDSSKEFTPEAVLSAVAIELNIQRSNNDLEVLWDEKAEPRVEYEVVRRFNSKVRFIVHRSEADAENRCQAIIHKDLVAGTFFDKHFAERVMLEEVAKVCNLSDLTSYLTMVAREGWVMPIGEDEDFDVSDQITGVPQAISEIKNNRAVLLSRWLKDPVAAVWKIHGGDVQSVLAVLIEQCSYDVDELTKAIMNAMGGWRSLSVSTVTATTSEGFIIEAKTKEASDYLEGLYTISKNGSPVTTR